ncbi:MAG: hypothetical protein LC637_08750 [Xanthomonadaceae bacterium]|nr:hypothetical protein [Xanthomonadaceae bacterium]
MVQGTFETYAECARQHFGGTLNVTAGCGGMGGAQPLAITMNGGTCLIADVDSSRLERRKAKRYLDEVHHDLDMAIDRSLALKAVSAPIVIGRDHLDCGSVASPNRETEGMKDGSDAISDWPLLNAMVNVASGASWVRFHLGGGVGIGYSQHAGQVIVADGTPEAAARLKRVLANDPATGVFRHVSAGYDEARTCAGQQGLDSPFDRRGL